MLFTAVLTGALAVPLGVLSFRTYQRHTNTLRSEEKTDMENRSYLLLLTAAVILFVKLLSWPFFYVTLQSYVPDIRGAMCIFGVTQFNPSLSGAVQIFKPAVFFLIGGWLLLNQLDKKTETSPLFRKKFAFLSVVSVMALADSTIDVIYFTGLNPQSSVACCTTYFDLPERLTSVLPAYVAGAEYERYMLPSYYFLNVSLSVFMAASNYVMKKNPSDKYRIRFITAAAIIAVLTAIVTVFVMFEVIAPGLMKLPHHHCIYCMWQYVPDSVVMTAFFIVGIFCPGWALLLNLTGKHHETETALREFTGSLYFAGIVCLSASLIMVTIHLLL